MARTKDSSTRKKSGVNSRSTGKKKTNRRQRAENPALGPKYNLKSRTELFDQDYIHKLNEEEAAWLNKFNEEYINTTLDRKKLKNNLHNTKKLKKDCDKRSNDRRACILTRQKVSGKLQNLDDIEGTPLNPVNYMNTAIDMQLAGYIEKDGTIKKKKD